EERVEFDYPGVDIGVIHAARDVGPGDAGATSAVKGGVERQVQLRRRVGGARAQDLVDGAVEYRRTPRAVGPEDVESPTDLDFEGPEVIGALGEYPEFGRSRFAS